MSRAKSESRAAIRLTTNMRVADLIRIGGGLKPSADTQAADLTQYQWSDECRN